MDVKKYIFSNPKNVSSDSQKYSLGHDDDDDDDVIMEDYFTPDTQSYIESDFGLFTFLCENPDAICDKLQLII